MQVFTSTHDDLYMFIGAMAFHWINIKGSFQTDPAHATIRLRLLQQ